MREDEKSGDISAKTGETEIKCVYAAVVSCQVLCVCVTHHAPYSLLLSYTSSQSCLGCNCFITGVKNAGKQFVRLVMM